MKESISWSKAGIPTRNAVVRLCGWETRKNTLSPIGKRISKTEWFDILPGTRAILERAGVMP